MLQAKNVGGTEELPAGWEKRITKDGKVFYIDHKTRFISRVILPGVLYVYQVNMCDAQILPKKESAPRIDSFTKSASTQAEEQVCDCYW